MSVLPGRRTSVALLLAVLAVFALLSPEFRRLETVTQILLQASSLVIVATGMTFVMITGGIDLSVGAVMFLGAALAGKLALGLNAPLAVIVPVLLAVGLVWGSALGLLVTRWRLVPFVVTLAALFIGRGLGLAITRTRAMNLPESFHDLATGSLFGVPIPIVLAALVVTLAQVVLHATPFGRQLFAAGEDAEKARKAGVAVRRVVAAAYVICGFTAALGGLVSLCQLGAVSPSFGEGDEFLAIAAAVLGGTSLFGGRGSVIPGTLVGALIMQTLRVGLNVLNADPYSYPLITAATIFIAVWIDSARERRLERSASRRIRAD